MMSINRDIDDTLEQIELAVFSDVTVLITGDKAAGKRLARLIHRRGRRAGARFAVLNAGRKSAAALSADLRTLAPGGTIVVQGLASLGPRLQDTLFEHLGRRCGDECGIDPTPVAPRLIFTTPDDLHARMIAGGIREDLFYRINMLQIRLEPLSATVAALLPHTKSTSSVRPRRSSTRRSAARLFNLEQTCPWGPDTMAPQ